MATETVESRLDRLEALDAIRQLKARYCQTADDSACAREFADLFLEDAVLDEGEEFMVLHGREQIYRAHIATWQHTRMNQHLAVSPTIEVNGDSATGHWKLLQLITSESAEGRPQAFWSCGWYREQYQRTAEGWRFRHVEARIHFCSLYDKGWATSPFDEVLPLETVETIVKAARGEI
jgi:hypothetical protein